jgi:hypothetical protein
MASEALRQGLGRRPGIRRGRSVETPAYAIGQAIFIRTDTADYAEQAVPFRSLEEMVDVCSKRLPNMILEKVIVYSLANGEPCALTLCFLAATKGQRPSHLEVPE